MRLAGVTKRFADVTAVDDLSLDIIDGEFLTLLGPSGSGKTTALRLIAGFEQPTAGQIDIAGRPVTHLPPYLREVNTVFQDYALFPHMTVAQNIEYGLRVRGVQAQERASAARQALAQVQLDGYGDRKPSQLSGGQRQRVALARALVNRPRVLLLDEPLGALDLKLRRQMQRELKQMQREVGITFVFVTHDQEEALTMSDRIAVFNAGRIEQLGTPREVYERPTTAFVADFIGTMNRVPTSGGGAVLIRPERMTASTVPLPADARQVTGNIVDLVYLGAAQSLVVQTHAGTSLSVTLPSDAVSLDYPVGAPVWCTWPKDGEFTVTP